MTRTLALFSMLATALLCGGCEPWLVGHLRNETSDTIGILRHGPGAPWCWTTDGEPLDTYRLAPHRWVRISLGTGRDLGDVLENIECDTIMLLVGGRRRAVTRGELRALEPEKVGSTYFLIVR